MKKITYKPGDIVLYRTGQYAFGAVVESEPWELGCGREVVNLCALGPSYKVVRADGRTRVNAAGCRDFLQPAQTEYVDGEWIVGTDDSDPAAVITYASEPSPETGHVGWCWWALGEMGDAEGYEQAKIAAEEVVRRRGGL